MQISTVRSDILDMFVTIAAPVFIGVSQHSPVSLLKNVALYAALLTNNTQSVQKLLKKHSYSGTKGYLTRRIFEQFLEKQVPTELFNDYLSDKPCIDLDDLIGRRMVSLYSILGTTPMNTLLDIINSGCIGDNLKIDFWYAVHYSHSSLTQQEQTVLCDAMYDKFQQAYTKFLTDDVKQFSLSSTQSTDNFTHIFARNASVSTLCSFIETNSKHLEECIRMRIHSSILYNFTRGLLHREQQHSLIDLLQVFDKKNLLPLFCKHVQPNFAQYDAIPDYNSNLLNFTTPNLKIHLINTFLEYNQGQSNIILKDLQTYKEVLQSNQQREKLMQAIEYNKFETQESDNCLDVDVVPDNTVGNIQPHSTPPVRKRKM